MLHLVAAGNERVKGTQPIKVILLDTLTLDTLQKFFSIEACFSLKLVLSQSDHAIGLK